MVGPNAQVQGRTLGEAEARNGGGVPCNDQLGRWRFIAFATVLCLHFWVAGLRHWRLH